jgi:hypothetical protein
LIQVNLGSDFLAKTGIDIKYSTETIIWFKKCNPLQMTEKEFSTMAKMAEVQAEDSQFGIDWFDPTCCSIEILNAKYDPVSTDKVIEQCSH